MSMFRSGDRGQGDKLTLPAAADQYVSLLCNSRTFYVIQGLNLLTASLGFPFPGSASIQNNPLHAQKPLNLLCWCERSD